MSREDRERWIREDVNGGIDIMPFMNKSIESRVQKEQEKYKAPKGTLKNAQQRKLKINKKRVALLVATAALSGGMIFGGVKACDNYKTQNSPITIDQALDMGMSLNQLGIDEEIYNDIKRIDERLEKRDLEGIEGEIQDLQFSVIKNKIEDVLPEKYTENMNPMTDIRLSPETRDSNAEINQEAKAIVNLDEYNKISFEVSDDITKFIANIDKMGTNERNVNSGEVKSEDNIKAYEKYLKEIKQMAAKEFSIKGNEIKTSTTKVKDMKNIKNIEEER